MIYVLYILYNIKAIYSSQEIEVLEKYMDCSFTQVFNSKQKGSACFKEENVDIS